MSDTLSICMSPSQSEISTVRLNKRCLWSIKTWRNDSRLPYPNTAVSIQTVCWYTVAAESRCNVSQHGSEMLLCPTSEVDTGCREAHAESMTTTTTIKNIFFIIRIICDGTDYFPWIYNKYKKWQIPIHRTLGFHQIVFYDRSAIVGCSSIQKDIFQDRRTAKDWLLFTELHETYSLNFFGSILLPPEDTTT